MPTRKRLSMDALLATCREQFKRITDPRSGEVRFSLPDALMAGLALYILKDSSLLAFHRRVETDNFSSVFGIEQLPSDTQLREILDAVDPALLGRAYRALFAELQRGKVLDSMRYLEEGWLLSLDGVEYFSSHKVHCAKCLERKPRGKVEPEYYHQMLAAVIVHPEKKQVLPLRPEPIQRTDGTQKNDCERNAGVRFLQRFRKEHPHLKVVVVEDGLSSNGPHIRELKATGCHFILGAKDGDHASLQRQLNEACQNGTARTKTITMDKPERTGTFVWCNGLRLNDSHPDLLINYLRYFEEGPKGKTREFAWVTDIRLSEGNVERIMRSGRARWRIENETFNTLKNQGYHFEHNFGHGKENLGIVFAFLMMLAFFLDQIQELTNRVFQAGLQAKGCKRDFWEQQRGLWHHHQVESMEEIYAALAYGIHRPPLRTRILNSS